MMTTRHQQAKHEHRRWDGVEYRLIWAAAFAVFLAFGLVEKVLSVAASSVGLLDQQHGSVVARAGEAARRCATYAFMG